MTPKLCLSCIITMMFQTVCCQAQDNDREYWIDRYLSVSYPLEQIQSGKILLRAKPLIIVALT